MPQLIKIRYITAEPYYFVFAVAFCTNAFTLPKVILDQSCYTFYKKTKCQTMTLHLWGSESNEIHDMAAKYSMYNQIAIVIPAFFTLLLFGVLSDKLGKRNVLLIPPILLTIQNILYAVLTKSITHPKYYMVVGIVSGIYGDFVGITMMTSSYMASATRRSTRTLRLCVIEGLLYLSFLPSIVIAGLMAVYWGTYTPYIFNAVLGILAFLYVLFVLPPPSHLAAENIDDNHMESIELDTNTPFCAQLWKLPLSFKEIFNDLYERGFLKVFIPVLIAVGIYITCGNSEVDITSLYYRREPLNFNTIQLSFLICLNGLVRGVGLIAVSQICIRWFKASDLQIVILGGSFRVIGSLLIGISNKSYQIWLITCMAWPVCIDIPVLRSIVSKFVDDNHHGTVLSLYALVDLISSFFASIISNNMYRLSLHSYHGLPYLTMGGMAIAATIITVVVYLLFNSVIVEQSEDDNDENEALLLNDK